MRTLILTLLVVGYCMGSAHAADISPTFESMLSRATTDEFVSGIIILESPIDIASLDVALHSRKAPLAERYDEVYHALRQNANQTQPRFRAELDAAVATGLVKGYTPYWIENLFVVLAKREFFLALRNRGDVRALSENFQAKLIEPAHREFSFDSEDETRIPEPRSLDEESTEPGQDAIGATRVNRELGITGQGVLVANLDTGVDGNHPALAARWRGNFAPASECWLDVLGTGTTSPVDNNSHGTHVMGTICGREIDGNQDTITVGSAPDALWIASNAIDQGASGGFDNDVLDAYEWFANPDGDPLTLDDVPDVIQNSWGVNEDFPDYTECWDLWNTAIMNLEALGVVVTFSAGNESTEGQRSPAIHALSEVQMFSVGAVSAQAGELPPFDIAPFSSLGPSLCNGNHIKPEIVAPGVNVNSSVPGGGYNGTFSGTSMAGPHVAGIVALMRQACPDCDPITIKQALINTAIDDGYLPVGNDNTFGYGFIDGYNAVLAVSDLGYIACNVTHDGLPLPGVEVSVVETNSQRVTDAQGAASLPLAAGSYTLTLRKFGFDTVTLTNIVVVTDETTLVNQAMSSTPEVTISGHVFDSEGTIVIGATVSVANTPVPSVLTDDNGAYQVLVPVGDTFTLRATDTESATSHTLFVNGNLTLDFYLPGEFLCYDFESDDQGWFFDVATSTASSGNWEWTDPEQTLNTNGVLVQPEDDHTSAPATMCFVTGGSAGSFVGEFDVDGGITVLKSPVWDLSNRFDVALGIYSWFTNDNGFVPNQDFFDVEITDDGVEWISLLHENDDWENWRRHVFVLEEYISLTDQVQLRITAEDLPGGSLVEAALDDVCLYAGSLRAPQQLTAIKTETGIALNWQSVPGATSYAVWRGTEFPPTLLNATIISTVTDTEFVDTTSLDTIGFYIVTANR